MSITNQNYSQTLLDFIIDNYNDVKYVIEWMDKSNITDYDEFVSGHTDTQSFPDVDEPVEIKYTDEYIEKEPITKLENKSIDQSLFDIVLQNYGELDYIIEHLDDAKIENYSNYKGKIEYRQDNINNNYTTYLKRENKMISTYSNIMAIIPSGVTIDTGGDFNNDFSNDFNI